MRLRVAVVLATLLGQVAASLGVPEVEADLYFCEGEGTQFFHLMRAQQVEMPIQREGGTYLAQLRPER